VKNFQQRYGSWAVVTGASSGVGEEFCRQLAALGLNLVLVARRGDRLTALAQQLARAHAIDTRVAVVDLSRDDFLPAIAAVTDTLDVGLLVNNAGFALTGDFLSHRLEDETALLHVNCRAPVMLAHHFGRRLVQRGRGGIINISSASAFMPLPYWAQYSASKIFLLHFSEALWFELKRQGVDVLALCPGSLQTEFAAKAGTTMRGTPAAPVVARALRALGRKVSVIPGAGNVVASLIGRLLTRRRSVILGSMVIGAPAD
jgi:short-subunit dehydrogenase